jgi:hypothetical protein
MDYKNGKIYCIRNSINDEVYVGSTTQPLSKRMVKHRCSAKTMPNKMKITMHMEELGFENFYIELVEEFPCENKEQLNRKEGEWIRKIGTLNSKIPGRTPTERRIDNADKLKQYAERNREHILQIKRDYHNKHREEERAKARERYHANKIEILAKAKEWKTTKNECECGGSYVNSSKSHHMKTNMHQAYLKAKHQTLKKHIKHIKIDKKYIVCKTLLKF